MEIESDKITVIVSDQADVYVARSKIRQFAETAGFNEKQCNNLAIIVSELGSNIVRYTEGGTITAHSIENNGEAGIEISAIDSGPGLRNIEEAMADGYSTGGSLGYGLGTVNRMMDELSIQLRTDKIRGTIVLCRLWIKERTSIRASCPLDFSVSTRPHPRMELNGDSFVLKTWNTNLLIGVIDGLGHGQFAHRASQKAVSYISEHYDRPLLDIFLGTQRACRATRGVVMAIARIDWQKELITFGSVGNIECRIISDQPTIRPLVRRGIIGNNAPNPLVAEGPWPSENSLFLFSDGITSHWSFDSIKKQLTGKAADVAHYILTHFSRDHDDATIAVVKKKQTNDSGKLSQYNS